ncbi:MAG: hypothetical protein OCC45_09245 [Desulfotalea sp.]
MSERETKIDEIKVNNQLLLEQFRDHLETNRLSTSTINKHVGNIEFYINDFLLYFEELQLAKEGYYQVNYFLGDWFIRKAMWASVSSIKSNITSLKKFYQFMYEIGEIKKEDLDDLKVEIKEGKNEWIETCKNYDNPDIDMEDVW